MTAPQSHPEEDRSEEGASGSTTGISAAAATHPHTRLLNILGRYRALQRTAPEDRFIRDAAVNSFAYVPDNSEEEDFQSAEEEIPPLYSVFRPEMEQTPRYERSWFDDEGRERGPDNDSRHEDEDEHGPDTPEDDERGPDNAPENGEAGGDDSKRPFKGYPQYKHLLHGGTWTNLYGEKEFPDPQKNWYPKVIRDRVMVMGRTAHTEECDSPCDHCKQKGLHCIVWKKSSPPKPFRANATCLHCFSGKRTCKRTPKPAPKPKDVPPSKSKTNSAGKKSKKAAIQPEAPPSDQAVPTTPGGSKN
ncbi:hypothetical protein DBV05_g1549 [Lasiodiplodia theobromae]|uniref:Uncharacterized protein n=1 Tax=Lasiodiplodia theobromae TaxID=45133 RepID=A0A5N5DQ32_9PEZI|nr:hypothetical protein DBV05_g1549 [Lasiodiplodia theobromae]